MVEENTGRRHSTASCRQKHAGHSAQNYSTYAHAQATGGVHSVSHPFIRPRLFHCLPASLFCCIQRRPRARTHAEAGARPHAHTGPHARTCTYYRPGLSRLRFRWVRSMPGSV